ncbi:probable tRNA (uracil-O(2)-)-methyltransferase isoform X3 [Hydra vulgaris]|uniref:tRNA (uracil-O(2)-)-methyltransferase n=1 Tax=Hydra vulgaris TaxID=6087 RepID=A0ABM4CPQ2_HYDVU
MFVIKESVDLNCTVNDVLDAIDVWCVKPHVLNRRLAGCAYIFQRDFNCVYLDSILPFTELKCFINETFLNELKKLLESCFKTKELSGKCILRKLLPKCLERYEPMVEFVIISTDSSFLNALFVPLCGVEGKETFLEYTYCLEFNQQTASLSCSTLNKCDTNLSSSKVMLTSTDWLSFHLLPKIKAWSFAANQSSMPLRKTQSLSLIDVEEYTKLYNELKNKYAPYFVQIWPESTDPLKFVFEDIAIATYLLLIWKDERDKLCLNKKQTFVDLGCGNGLLVHILSSEGHPGQGVDLVKRKIWSLYSQNTILKESSLQPDKLRVDEDWIIGNHSDELTPWIPVIALRSSYSTRYFVLPCCFFDFHSKFHRTDQKCSQYLTYLKYIFNIGVECGFNVNQDILRIPSTKRICQIGGVRSYPIEDQSKWELKALQLTRFSLTPEFIPRKINNDPMNCSHINKDIVDFIKNKVFRYLLNCSECLPKITFDSAQLTTKGFSWNEWNSGGNIHLNNLSFLFDSEILHSLKSQHGGLQTLLKNHRNIFKVVNGNVSIRDYRCVEDLKRSKKSLSKKKDTKSFKSKLCWFFDEHPQGCVLSIQQCSYAHGVDDLCGS